MSEVSMRQATSNKDGTLLVDHKIKRQRYQANRRAPLGTNIECANCGRIIRKKQSTTQFCSTRGGKSCENQYWSDNESS
ncbi:MAG TPA: hypothetical protein DEH24_12125 [Alteromonas sp.]|nr:hypothetical protein [Alteromonas sp.]